MCWCDSLGRKTNFMFNFLSVHHHVLLIKTLRAGTLKEQLYFNISIIYIYKVLLYYEDIL